MGSSVNNSSVFVAITVNEILFSKISNFCLILLYLLQLRRHGYQYRKDSSSTRLNYTSKLHSNISYFCITVIVWITGLRHWVKAMGRSQRSSKRYNSLTGEKGSRNNFDKGIKNEIKLDLYLSGYTVKMYLLNVQWIWNSSNIQYFLFPVI